MQRFWLSMGLATLALLQNPPPATDVFLATFARDGVRASIGKPTNISNNPGYDNQPSFTPDGRAVLFTSVRGNRQPDPANSAQTGSDIYRYDIATGRLSQLTSTLESEYSPTVMPDGAHFSVIQVERDGTQRLWKFPVDGGKPSLLLPDVKPVGYHAWADRDAVALFVLGEPASLQIARVSGGSVQQVAKDIGRSVLKIPGGGVSFVLRTKTDGKASVSVMRFDPVSGGTELLTPVVAGVTDPNLAWTPDGTLLMTHEDKLLGWRKGDAGFATVADLASMSLRGASRLAVSPSGDRIAIVALE